METDGVFHQDYSDRGSDGGQVQRQRRSPATAVGCAECGIVNIQGFGLMSRQVMPRSLHTFAAPAPVAAAVAVAVAEPCPGPWCLPLTPTP